MLSLKLRSELLVTLDTMTFLLELSTEEVICFGGNKLWSAKTAASIVVDFERPRILLARHGRILKLRIGRLESDPVSTLMSHIK